MSSFPSVILHHHKAHAVKRFHPWVFSGAVKKIEGQPGQGDVVNVLSDKGEFLGVGHYGAGGIAVRLFAFEKVDNLNALWKKKFEAAYNVRKAAELINNTSTNAYRLINAEGDGMPGLIIDWYNGTAVIQAHSQGMYNERLNFTDVLKGLYGPALKAVYDKSSAKLNEEGGAGAATDSYLYGSNAEHIVMENGHRFTIDWVQGQKTGFFLDQRDNRQLLANYAANKKILNTFCYSGGFSVYGLKAGASLVHSVDSSAKAIELTDANIRLNEFDPAKHQSYTSDVFEFLKGADTDYDIIILDPPAFAKGHSARHSAIKAYTRLNLTALQKIKPGGLVFTFSCSQVVDRDMFAGAVTAAAIESGRDIKILHHLTQPADHPVSIYNPEGLYLKGLVLYAGE